MCSVLIVLIFSLIGLSVSVDPYLCNPLQVIDPSVNISLPYTYPAGWNGTNFGPKYAKGQNCSWIINVPIGMFANLAIKAKTSWPTVITLINSIGAETKLQFDYTNEPFYFNSPKFIINLNAGESGNLGFHITWFKYPGFEPVNYEVHQKGDPLVLSSASLNSPTVFTADTRVSVVGLPAGVIILADYMRATFLFDGPSWNSTFITTLYDCFSTSSQCVSTGKQLTAFTLSPKLHIGSHALVQDYSDVRDIAQYIGFACDSGDHCQITANATNGKSAIMTYTTDPWCLESAQISDKATMNVYYGRLQESNLIRTYNHSQISNSFPQKFNGFITTYVIDRGTALLKFTTNVSDCNWNVARDGRVGFIASDNYMSPIVYNMTNEEIGGNGNYKYSLNFRETGITGTETLKLTVMKKDETSYDQTFSKSNPPPKTIIVAEGNTLNINYNTNGENASGFFMDFNIQKTAASYGLLVPLLISVVAFAQCQQTHIFPGFVVFF